MAVSAVAAVYIIRRLELPWWWLAFPPLVLGVGSANPGVVLLALLLWGHPVAEAIACGLKVYAVVPLVARKRVAGLAASAFVFGITVILAPGLVAYLNQGQEVTGRLVTEALGGAGASAFLWLIPLTVLAIIVIARYDLPAAGWLAVPALWPAGQFHYAVMALPVVRLWPAALMAMPVPGFLAVAVILQAWLIVRGRSQPAEPSNARAVAGPATGVSEPDSDLVSVRENEVSVRENEREAIG